MVEKGNKMDKWNIRMPYGKITSEYPFDDSYKKILGNRGVIVFALTQEEGMRPDLIAPQVERILGQIRSAINDESKKTLIMKGKEKIETDSVENFTEKLKSYADDLQSAWYWDGVKGVINSSQVDVLIQPESDGMEIAVYTSGIKADKLVNYLESSMTKA